MKEPFLSLFTWYTDYKTTPTPHPTSFLIEGSTDLCSRLTLQVLQPPTSFVPVVKPDRT